MATPSPSTADSTEMAGVMTPSPYSNAAPNRAANTTHTPERLSLRPGTRANSAKMPPSPLLSARMMNDRYFTATTMMSDQKNSDKRPSTESCVTGIAW